MADQEDAKTREFYEEIMQNTQKGDTYRIKFKRDNTVYEGIPVISPTESSDEGEAFLLKVLKPKGGKEQFTELISEIEYLKRT